MGKGPLRTCVGCRTTRPQAELIRVVAGPQGAIVVRDRRGHVSGRGAYVCGNRSCVERALESGALRRALGRETDIPRELPLRLVEIARQQEMWKGRNG